MSTSDRIAIVCHSHPDVTKGGAELAAYALFRGLREMGRDVVFVASVQEADVLKVQPRPGEYVLTRDPDIYDHFYQIAPPESARRLKELLVALNVGVVNFHHFLFIGLNAITALRDTDMRLYLTLHEYLGICHHHGQMVTRPAKNLCRAASRLNCQACFPEIHGEEFDIRRHHFQAAFDALDGVVSPSHFLKSRYVDWGLDAARIQVIENGLLDLDAKVTAAVDRSEAESDKGEKVFTIGYFGQITPFKGVGVVLDAIERFERAMRRKRETEDLALRFRIHGNLVGLESDFVERFEQLADRSSYLQFVGPYANTEVINLMRACDYVIVPSQWWENSPVVIQEAYAAGCPVIASDIGGLAEKVVDGTSGLHFRMGDPDSLLATLKRAASTEVLEELRAGLPAVMTARDMAEAYQRNVFADT